MTGQSANYCATAGLTCPTCNVVASSGTSCVAATAGTDPKNDCVPDPTVCRGDFCDGAGNCQPQPNTVMCAMSTCSGSTYTPPRFCDGTSVGLCPAALAGSCSPYLCANATSCAMSCMTNADCISTAYSCTGGLCKLNTGQLCKYNNSAGTSTECASGFCQDGYCCATACTGACKQCNQTGSEGTCTNVAYEMQPVHGLCAYCGLCTGAGTCCTMAQCNPLTLGYCTQ
jgi:hypothetical protein